MDIQRRDFVKGCATASILLLPGIASAATGKKANKASAPESPSDIEKSIKASFGGGFSVGDHTQSGGRTRATIEHFGNRYTVVSPDLLDWKIVEASF
ncbi:twin-arginine translocation signal domain-containing protein [Nitrobacter sp. JJSN]|uniref:twin-arginine translocation signal domain-containing protein n=1 Tax=Nitrobacter sp. JJSN TaxID=3453033 RepID=UPI003F75F520